MKAMLLSLLSLSFASFAASCTASGEIVGIHMSSEETVTVPYGEFTYDDINVTIDYRDGNTREIPLVEDMISDIEKLKFFKVGNQDVEVTYRSRYSTTMPIDVTLKEFKDSYALVGDELIYDGEPHMVTLNQELPEGATITYPYGNVFTNAGVYEVVGVMSKNGYASKTLTTTLTIHPATRPVEGILFEDTTLVYNGEMRNIEIQHVPEGVEVTYDAYDYATNVKVNKVVNAGTYKVVAHFNDVNPNYAKIEDMSATLTILKADYDISKIGFEDVVKEYDGKNYDAAITNERSLPTGVKVSYSYLDADGNTVQTTAAVGTYTMVASFSGGDIKNYNEIQPLKATLRVEPQVIKVKDKVIFDGKTVNFDESVTHSLAVTGDLPAGVEVTYENNDQTLAGEYEVIAHFKATDSNKVCDISELRAYLVINRIRRSVTVLDETTGEYTAEFSAANLHFNGNVASVDGIDTDVFEVISITFYDALTNEEVAVETIEDDITYKYLVRFAYKDPDLASSVILSDESDTFSRQTIKVWNEDDHLYNKPFSASNISIVNLKPVVTGLNDEVYKATEVEFFDGDGNKVAPKDLVEGNTYDYVVHVDYIDEAMYKSNVIIDATGSFETEVVKFLNTSTSEYTEDPSFDNIVIDTQKGVLSGFDTTKYKYRSAAFFDNEGNEVAPRDLVHGTTYQYYADFDYINPEAHPGKVLIDSVGSIAISRVLTKDQDGHYTLPFTAQNIRLRKDSLLHNPYRHSTYGYDSSLFSYTNADVRFYDGNGNVIAPIDMEDDVTYTYDIPFEYRFPASYPDKKVVHERDTFVRRSVPVTDLTFEIYPSSYIVKPGCFDDTIYKVSRLRFVSDYGTYDSEIADPYNQLIDGNTYTYNVDFIYVDSDAGKNVILTSEVGTFVYNAAEMKKS